MKARCRWGYFWGYFCFNLGVFSLSGISGEKMALTDTGVRKAKAKDTAYRLSDGGGLYLWITPEEGQALALEIPIR